jgi:hypothetical protein
MNNVHSLSSGYHLTTHQQMEKQLQRLLRLKSLAMNHASKSGLVQSFVQRLAQMLKLNGLPQQQVMVSQELLLCT